MKFDNQWDLLVEDLWKYQYVQKPCNPKDSIKLSKVLYEETQGITDLVIKLFMFSQELAISSGREEINSSIIRSAAKDKFNLLKPVIKAFKDKDKTALIKFEDAYPVFLQDFIAESDESNQIIGEILNEPEIKIDLTLDSKTTKDIKKGEQE